jgi:hypothetical protein
MERKVLNLKGSVKGKVISVGIDVHSLSWQVTALADSEVIMAVTISKPDYSKLKALLARLQGNILRVAMKRGLPGLTCMINSGQIVLSVSLCLPR